MKICIVTDQYQVSMHFGQSKTIDIYEVDNQRFHHIETIDVIHEHEGIPALIMDTKIKYLICGNLGDKARTRLTQAGITILEGVTGDVNEVIQAFASGQLISKDGTCEEHNHHHEHHGVS